MVRRADEKASYVPSADNEEPSVMQQIYNIEFGQRENRQANLSLIASVGVFAGSIAFLRIFGGVLDPIF